MVKDVKSLRPSTDYLSEISPKDKPWDRHAVESERVAELYKGGKHGRYADRIEQCSQYLEFKRTTDMETGETKYRLSMANFCRVRHCPKCQWRRNHLWIGRFFKRYEPFLAKYSDVRYIFLTLTLRNCKLEDLRETLGLIGQSWQRFTQRIKFPALGYVKSIEVTRSVLGEAHPHLHVILAVNPEYFTHGYLTQVEWEALWKDCLRVDYFPRVDIRAVRGKKGELASIEKRLIEGVLETFKYSIKPADLMVDKEWLDELTVQLKNTRFVSVSGIFRELFGDKEPDNLVNDGDDVPEDSPGYFLYFKWLTEIKRYCKDDKQSDFPFHNKSSAKKSNHHNVGANKA